MDWARAIEINQAALARIVAALIAMVGVEARGALPRPLYRAALSMLRPVESAVRRLIVIAARGLAVKPSRPMPAGLALGGRGAAMTFQLFDARKRFRVRRPSRAVEAGPRVLIFGASPLVLLFQRRPAVLGEPKPYDGEVNAERLGRRLQAVKLALEDLPRQAQRLKRWQARRNRMTNPKFSAPLRQGPPPVHRKEPKDEVDFVLRECHALAREALREDSS